MKKFLVAIAALFVAVSASAQFGVTAGVTSTETSFKDAVTKAGDITQYHVGVSFKLNLGIFAVQPALLYNVKGQRLGSYISGATLEEPVAGEVVVTSTEQTGFLELPVQLQVGYPFRGFRPYVFAEPFVGYAITNESTKDITDAAGNVTAGTAKKGNWDNVKNRLEYGVGLGAGVDILDAFQISVRYFWNVGELYKKGETTTAEGVYNDTINSVKSRKCNGIMASIAFFF